MNLSTIKKSVNDYKFKKNLTDANSEVIVMPFLHGLQISYLKFGSYLFVQDTSQNRLQLKARSFSPLVSEVLTQDPILKLGTEVFHNKKFNLLFVLVSEENWELLDASIDIAKSSSKHFEAQCHIVLSTTEILSKRGFEFKAAQK